MKVSILYLFPILLALSCSPAEPCEEDSISELVAVFKSETNGEVSDTTLSKLWVYGIRDNQDVWYPLDTIRDSGKILLPLDPHRDQSSFVFQANGFSDTLTLSHKSEDYLISFSCGFGNLFTLEPEPATYTGGIIKKDTLINPLVSSTLEESETHIWLYL